MTVTLHTDMCISCGMCASIAPELFSVDTAVVSLKKDPASYTQNDWDKAKEAAAACPGNVIVIDK